MDRFHQCFYLRIRSRNSVRAYYKALKRTIDNWSLTVRNGLIRKIEKVHKSQNSLRALKLI